MSVDELLLGILACPEDKGALYHLTEPGADEFLYNPRLRRRYEIRDGIPVMLIAESTTLDEAEHLRVMSIIERDGVRPTFSG